MSPMTLDPKALEIAADELRRLGFDVRDDKEIAAAIAANGNRRPFPSIAAAHLHLTGEPLDKRRFAQISRNAK